MIGARSRRSDTSIRLAQMDNDVTGVILAAAVFVAGGGFFWVLGRMDKRRIENLRANFDSRCPFDKSTLSRDIAIGTWDTMVRVFEEYLDLPREKFLPTDSFSELDVCYLRDDMGWALVKDCAAGATRDAITVGQDILLNERLESFARWLNKQLEESSNNKTHGNLSRGGASAEV